ncbi:hypothetical protein LCGC14_0181230 [marine sediment metagenome]|uniref:Uncharacterized protein n=1 Tax=marine sediment metagenome TaxID=412755 RepID=A0A0F9UPI7_9ZZZZ
MGETSILTIGSNNPTPGEVDKFGDAGRGLCTCDRPNLPTGFEAPKS